VAIVSAFPREVRVIEHMPIPLGDGTELAARIWLPVDAERHPVPAILEYLPYRKRDGTNERDALTHPWLAGHGYAGVRVDIRGTGDSSGLIFDEYAKQEHDDALEVIAWLARQPWCSGAVGMMGISWGGFNALQVAALRPPALRAIVSLCSTDDRYRDDVHRMGGALLADGLGWASFFFRTVCRPPDHWSASVGGRCGASGWRTCRCSWRHGSGTSGATPTGSTARSARITARYGARPSSSAAGPTATPTRSRACSSGCPARAKA
jgi:predicted acyl esterase